MRQHIFACRWTRGETNDDVSDAHNGIRTNSRGGRQQGEAKKEDDPRGENHAVPAMTESDATPSKAWKSPNNFSLQTAQGT